MDSFHELLGIVIRNDLVFGIQEITLPIMFENCPKDPAVAVVVSKLRVLELWI